MTAPQPHSRAEQEQDGGKRAADRGTHQATDTGARAPARRPARASAHVRAQSRTCAHVYTCANARARGGAHARARAVAKTQGHKTCVAANGDARQQPNLRPAPEWLRSMRSMRNPFWCPPPPVDCAATPATAGASRRSTGGSLWEARTATPSPRKAKQGPRPAQTNGATRARAIQKHHTRRGHRIAGARERTALNTSAPKKGAREPKLEPPRPRVRSTRAAHLCRVLGTRGSQAGHA